MYHPSRGGVRGGRDQFKWDDVKVDKHRENYLGHSIKAPVGRWQKGKDLFWYARDKKTDGSAEAMKEEIRRIKEEEEQAMREALGLAPKRASRHQGNRLDKHEYAELIKRGSAAEDMEGGHAEAALVHGLGFKGPHKQRELSSLPDRTKAIADDKFDEPSPAARDDGIIEEDDGKEKRQREDEVKRREERKEDKRHRHEKKRHRDSDDKGKHRHRDKGKRKRHDSDSE